MVVIDEGSLIAGRYRLVTQVGSGAMGVVWQAHDELLNRTVAIKQLLLHASMSEAQVEEANRRAMREGRIAARLHHPHAITVYDVAEYDDKPCLIMEYLASQSLSTLLATRGALTAEEVASIGSQIASALAAAHEKGIVHRDIKPGNVLIADDGTAKITDFGIARAVGDITVTATGILAGTPAYLAPEVAQGHEAGFPADVFSLGSTLYNAVEGAPPFGLNDNAMAMLFRIATDEMTPPTQSGPLTPVLTRLLERDPAQRITMQQAQEELAAVADPAASPVPARRATAVLPQLPSSGTDKPASGSPAKGGDRRPPRWAIAVVVAAVALVMIGVLVATLLNNPGNTRNTASPTNVQGTSPRPQAPPPSSTETTTTKSAAPATATPTTKATTTTATTPTPPTTTQTTPTTTVAITTPVAPPPPANPPPGNTLQQMQQALADYYALMPGNLQAGWNRLTANYQQTTAGGFSGYQSFWNGIRQVQDSNITAQQPNTATATIDYYFKDGRTVEEQTSYTLVFEGGLWKIASSSVISSRTL